MTKNSNSWGSCLNHFATDCETLLDPTREHPKINRLSEHLAKWVAHTQRMVLYHYSYQPDYRYHCVDDERLSSWYTWQGSAIVQHAFCSPAQTAKQATCTLQQIFSVSYYTIKSLLLRLNAIRALLIQIQVQPWSTAEESSRPQGRAFDKLWRLLKYIFGSPSPPPPLLGRTTPRIEFAWTHAHCHYKIPLGSCNMCVAVNVIAKGPWSWSTSSICAPFWLGT